MWSSLSGLGCSVRSFLRILTVPLGFDPSRTLIVRTTLNRQRFSPDRRHAVERTIQARLASLPGVSAVALTTHVPLADERQIGFAIDGHAPDEFHWADNALVSGDYFRVMKIPLLSGRTFSDADTSSTQLVAVVNQTMAKLYWPRQNPIGKGFSWGGWHLTVIGLVGDVHVEALDKPMAPTIYQSVYQIDRGPSTSGVFLIRTQASTRSNATRFFCPEGDLVCRSRIADSGFQHIGAGGRRIAGHPPIVPGTGWELCAGSTAAFADRRVRSSILCSHATHARNGYSAGAWGKVKSNKSRRVG